MNIAKLLCPRFSWAFPIGSHHKLIFAAIGQDRLESLKSAHDWLAENKIDDVPFRDHRLLLAAAARFGQELSGHASYPRLVGLQRMLWTRSLMAQQEHRSALAKLTHQGIELLLIKGASRLAIDKSASKRRVASDIDIVVRPQRMIEAFDILVADGWTPSPGASCKYVREHLASTRSINLFKGNFGDIDLHRQPFHPTQGGPLDDEQLWAESSPAIHAGVAVHVPRTEDRIALAIAHGGLDGHTHSDWLVDCATMLHSERIDWDQLLETVMVRRLEVPAANTLLYLRNKLGVKIPAWFLVCLERSCLRSPFRLWSGLIQARPKDRAELVGQLLRGAVKKLRKISEARMMTGKPSDRVLRTKLLAATSLPASAPIMNCPFVKSYRFVCPPDCSHKSEVSVELILDVQPTEINRRIELEINSTVAHLCRIRFRKRANQKGPLRFQVTGSIQNPSLQKDLELVARPSRQLRSYASERERQRYDCVGFRVVSCKVA